MEKEQEVKKPRLLSDEIRRKKMDCHVGREMAYQQEELQKKYQEIKDSYVETNDAFIQSKYNFELYTTYYDIAALQKEIMKVIYTYSKLDFLDKLLKARKNMQDPKNLEAFKRNFNLIINVILEEIIICDNYELEQLRSIVFINNNLYTYFTSLYKKMKALKINIELQPKQDLIEREYEEELNKLKMVIAANRDKSDEEKRQIFELHKNSLDTKTDNKREKLKTEYINQVDSSENIKGKIDYDKIVQMRNEMNRFYETTSLEIDRIRKSLDANISTDRRKLLVAFQGYRESFESISKWIDILTPKKIEDFREEINFRSAEQNYALRCYSPTQEQLESPDNMNKIILNKYKGLSEEELGSRRNLNFKIIKYNLIEFSKGNIKLEDFFDLSDDDLLDIFLINGEVKKPKEESNQSVK